MKGNMPPFCYYCDRDFTDEKILIQHQRAKHFKCQECQKRLNTATALSLHYLSVHKREMTSVPFSLPDRCKTDLEIHGLEGVPFALIEKRANQRNMDLPLGFAEPIRPAIKKRKIVQSPYMQYYAQYYQYPTAAPVVSPTNEVKEEVDEKSPEVKEVETPIRKKVFDLEKIPYQQPKLSETAFLIIANPENIYEDVKFRAYLSSK
eukprot:NODE_58_length_28395_cov_1.465720.p18 type:complete len:205 gc:universal NODE_58_length_28395_cov_1.465720:22500-21886(-)